MSRLRCTLLLAAFILVPAHATEIDIVEEARSKTIFWLALVDTNQFDASWESAASLFQAAITKTAWSQTIAAVRTPIGVLRSRELSSSKFATSLPSAPDGEYVVFQFNASFENKASAVETVTAMRDADGEWKVSGYFIK